MQNRDCSLKYLQEHLCICIFDDFTHALEIVEVLHDSTHMLEIVICRGSSLVHSQALKYALRIHNRMAPNIHETIFS